MNGGGVWIALGSAIISIAVLVFGALGLRGRAARDYETSLETRLERALDDLAAVQRERDLLQRQVVDLMRRLIKQDLDT